VPEAQLEDFGSGLTPVTQGWFVVNVSDAEWWFSERRGARCAFESGRRPAGRVAGVHYPVSELAARYGASVAEETSDWRQAYATVERFRRERPPNWARLPWA
jgi:hypothetical protein